jgi:hypothetical protein
MRYNREQRKSIYADALEILSRVDARLGSERLACCALKMACRDEWIHVSYDFPEVFAFKNPAANFVWLSDEDDDTDPESKAGNELRQLVLIFAIELCDDQQFQNDLKIAQIERQPQATCTHSQ